jgi:hypothetical protein
MCNSLLAVAQAQADLHARLSHLINIGVPIRLLMSSNRMLLAWEPMS